MEYHLGETCEEYQAKTNNKNLNEDAKYVSEAMNLGYRQCTKCNLWIEKKEVINFNYV